MSAACTEQGSLTSGVGRCAHTDLVPECERARLRSEVRRER